MNLRKKNGHKTNTVTLIVSAELSELSTEENKIRTDNLRDRLSRNGFAFVEAQGFYKGVPEASFVVSTSKARKHIVLNWALLDNSQECVLVREDEKVKLVGSNFVQFIGTEIKLVPEAIAVKEDNYTKTSKGYFIVK